MSRLLPFLAMLAAAALFTYAVAVALDATMVRP